MNAACVCICIGKVYHRCGLRSCVCVFVFALFGLDVCQYASKAIAYALKEKETVIVCAKSLRERQREIYRIYVINYCMPFGAVRSAEYTNQSIYT